jgi:hypothetical protein
MGAPLYAAGSRGVEPIPSWMVMRASGLRAAPICSHFQPEDTSAAEGYGPVGRTAET